MKNFYSSALIIISLVTVSFFTSCRFGCIHGSGRQVSENRKLGNFTKIEISGGYHINIKQDSSLALTITADDNFLKHIHTTVEGNTLHIYTKRNLCGRGGMTVNIGVKYLEGIKASGAVEIKSEGRINAKDLSLDLSGASRVTMDLNAANLKTEGSGSTEINLTGEATSHDISLSGNGDINALNFVVGSYKVETSGSSRCHINVLRDLNIHTSGASEIEYRGNPVNFSNDKSGSSSIKKIN